MSRVRKSTTGNKDLLLRDRWLSCTIRGLYTNGKLCVSVCVSVCECVYVGVCVCKSPFYSLYINLSNEQSKNAP